MIYVYQLVDLSSRVRYIGITEDTEKRSYRHRLHMKPHTFQILSEHQDRADAGATEIRLIKELNTHVSTGGWNKTWGGEAANISGVSRKGVGGRKKGSAGNVGWKPSLETKQKWSEARKGKVASKKLSEASVKEMLDLYKSRPEIAAVGKTMPLIDKKVSRNLTT